MKHCIVLILLLALMVGTGCTGDSAEQLFEIAQLEERQHNLAHARDLYERITIEFPESPYAEKAQERLAEMQQNR